MNFSRLLCSVALLLNVTLAHAEAFKISDIRINGLQRVSAGSVFGALPLNVGTKRMTDGWWIPPVRCSRPASSRTSN